VEEETALQSHPQWRRRRRRRRRRNAPSARVAKINLHVPSGYKIPPPLPPPPLPPLMTLTTLRRWMFLRAEMAQGWAAVGRGRGWVGGGKCRKDKWQMEACGEGAAVRFVCRCRRTLPSYELLKRHELLKRPRDTL